MVQKKSMVVNMIEATSPSKLRKLNPKELTPPKEVLDKQKQRVFESRIKNPVFKFMFIFFGEGF